MTDEIEGFMFREGRDQTTGRGAGMTSDVVDQARRQRV